MRRLTGTVIVLSSVVLAGMGAVVTIGFGWLAALLSALLVVDLLAPYIVLVGGNVTRPIETHIQKGFKRSARRKLETHYDLTVIGITGSYGKTSVKFAIAEILSRRFSVIATPGSYNTPMGITAHHTNFSSSRWGRAIRETSKNCAKLPNLMSRS